MTNEIYITGPVIVNGIPDKDNDTLTSKEIRTIFTKYTNHLSDIQHDRVDYDGVHVLANWINEEPITIQGKNIPAKSWICTMKVTNPETITAIKNGELSYFSLGSISAERQTREAWLMDKRISYHDLKTIEDVIPLRISLVDSGANGFPFMIETREIYINKNNPLIQEDINMTNEETPNEPRFSIKEWLGLEKHFRTSINKSEEPSTPTPEPAPTPTTENENQNKNIDELFQKLDTIEEKLDKILKTQSESININKNENKPDENNEEDESEGNTENNPDETNEKDTKNKGNTKISINKSTTTKPADIPNTTSTPSTFYTNTGRDYFGRKKQRRY